MFTVYAKLNLAKYILQGNWYDTGIKIHSSFSSKEQLLCLDNITEMIYIHHLLRSVQNSGYIYE